MNKEAINKLLLTVTDDHTILYDEPMKNHTSFRVGGPADFFITPETTEAFCGLVRLCREHAIPFYVVGNGSNLLVRDGGFHGVMICTKALNHVIADGTTISAAPGALLKAVANKALDASLTGMEFASGIPGSIGGAVVMNAGAYDGEMKNIIDSIDVLTETGEIKRLPNVECAFGYRHSVIQEHPWYVVGINLALNKGDYTTIKAKMDDLNARRRDKQPLEYPSAGSTFRRPEGYFAGKLIQDCGFKGYSVGGAQVSEKHSGFVINKGDATAQDIITLIETIQKKVKDDFGVDMRTEVIMIGEA